MKSWYNTVCLDWDGVCEVFPRDNLAPAPIPGFQEGIQRLLDAEWYIEIYSGGSSSRRRLKEMQQNLRTWMGEEFWDRYVRTDRIVWATSKPTAKVYVDDRGMKFTSWEYITPETLKGFRAWWQHPGSTH